jgi:muramoyltetrapeptide carboxypeptidase LdcA involved in peptidoglycan recycling
MHSKSSGDWSRPLIKPPKLNPGDTIAVVTPSWGGPNLYRKRYDTGKRYLENTFGVKVIEMPNVFAAPDFLEQNPRVRARDIMRAYENPAVNAIVVSIGGDDAIRLIPHLDLSIIRSNPKLFVGYSDTTAIHFGLLKAGIGSLHGPSIMSGFAENCGMTSLSKETFQALAFDRHALGKVPVDPQGWTAEKLEWGEPGNQDKARKRSPSTGMQTLQGTGKVQGHLIGGCAEVLEMLKGSDWWPPIEYWDNAILFYETSEEAPSSVSVKRWLRNFAAQGILQRLSGFILGRPGGMMTDNDRDAQKQAVLQAFREAELTEVPIIADADIGHTDPIITLPYGRRAEIDCDTAQLSILESATS